MNLFSKQIPNLDGKVAKDYAEALTIIQVIGGDDLLTNKNPVVEENALNSIIEELRLERISEYRNRVKVDLKELVSTHIGVVEEIDALELKLEEDIKKAKAQIDGKKKEVVLRLANAAKEFRNKHEAFKAIINGFEKTTTEIVTPPKVDGSNDKS